LATPLVRQHQKLHIGDLIATNQPNLMIR